MDTFSIVRNALAQSDGDPQKAGLDPATIEAGRVLAAVQVVVDALTPPDGGRYVVGLENISTAGTSLTDHRVRVSSKPLRDPSLTLIEKAVVMATLTAHEIGHTYVTRPRKFPVNLVKEHNEHSGFQSVANIADDIILEPWMVERFPILADAFEFTGLWVLRTTAPSLPATNVLNAGSSAADRFNILLHATRYGDIAEIDWSDPRGAEERDWARDWKARLIALPLLDHDAFLAMCDEWWDRVRTKDETPEPEPEPEPEEEQDEDEDEEEKPPTDDGEECENGNPSDKPKPDEDGDEPDPDGEDEDEDAEKGNGDEDEDGQPTDEDGDDDGDGGSEEDDDGTDESGQPGGDEPTDKPGDEMGDDFDEDTDEDGDEPGGGDGEDGSDGDGEDDDEDGGDTGGGESDDSDGTDGDDDGTDGDDGDEDGEDGDQDTDGDTDGDFDGHDGDTGPDDDADGGGGNAEADADTAEKVDEDEVDLDAIEKTAHDESEQAEWTDNDLAAKVRTYASTTATAFGRHGTISTTWE